MQRVYIKPLKPIAGLLDSQSSQPFITALIADSVGQSPNSFGLSSNDDSLMLKLLVGSWSNAGDD